MKLAKIHFLAVLLSLAVFKGSFAQTITLTSPPNGNNQKSSVTQWIGLGSVTITYHGPDVHSPQGEDRRGHIWGELVHYGFEDPTFGPSKAAPWRTGSNEITTVTLSHDMLINGKELKAGTYGLFLAVYPDKPWIWIFSRNNLSWGPYYYNENEDVLRVESHPEDHSYVEWLTFGFEDRQANSTQAYLIWEDKKIGFSIELPNATQLYVDRMRLELTSFAGFYPQNWIRNAKFCLNNKLNLEEALQWVDNSMDKVRFNGTGENFDALKTKSLILRELGREDESKKIIDYAIHHPTASVLDIHGYGRELLENGRLEEAMKIFKYNKERNGAEKFVTSVGLARGYTALGNKKEAIRNWELAIKNIPEDEKANVDLYKKELAKLLEG